MSKEDLKEPNPKSKIKFENTVTKPLSQSRPVPKGFGMKENSDPARHESEPGKRASPLGTATRMQTNPNISTSSSYSYLNNPKVHFGSEVPHTLDSDTSRLNAPPSSSATRTNRNDSNSMLERIAFPYKLLKKYFASLPATIYGNGTADQLNGKRDIGTLVQTMSLILNGQNTSEENNNSSLKNFMEVPTSIEPLKVSNATQPTPHPVSNECGKQAIDDVGAHKVPPLLIEMLCPHVPANGKKNYGESRAKTKPEKETMEHETPVQKMSPTGTSADVSATHRGSCLTNSSKATNLFEVISKHVMSITSPGQSFDGNHTPLPRFQKQTSPMFTDSMFLRGRRSSDGSITIVDDSLTLSNEETLMSEQLESGMSSDLSSFDTNFSKQNNAHPTVVDSLKNVRSDLILGMDTKSTTVMELPTQMSLRNIFDEQYLSGKKKHSFNSNSLKANTSDGSTSINYHETYDSKEQDVKDKSGSGMTSDISSSVTIIERKNAHLASNTSLDSLKNVETEPTSVEDYESVTTMELSAQLSLHNLFDEEYLSGKKKHSFNSNVSNRHTSDDDTAINSLRTSDDSMQDITIKSGHGRRGESSSVLELRALMSAHGLLEEKNVNGKGKTTAHPLGFNHANFDGSVQSINGKVKAKAQSSASIRINFDDSVQDIPSVSNHGRKGESASVQELRSLMSKHGLLDNTNVNGKCNTKALPSGTIRINFDDSIEGLTSKSIGECKVKSPSVQDLHSDMSVHGIVDEKDIPGEKSQTHLESSDRYNISSKESTPTIVLYREESVVPHYKKPMQKNKELSDTKGNAFEVLIKERDDSITIDITELNSHESGMPLKSTLDGIQDKSLKTQRNPKTVTIDSISTNENNSYNSFGPDEQHTTTSAFLDDEVGRDPYKCNENNIEGDRTDVDRKLLCENRKSSRDLHSMSNAEILHSASSSWRQLPIVLYRPTSESNDIAYETPATSINDSESRFKRSESQGLRRTSKATSESSGPLEEDVSLENFLASLESSEGATPEDSMDEFGSGSEDSPKSGSLVNWSPISVVSSTSESMPPGESGSASEVSSKSDSLTNWSLIPALSTALASESTVPGGLGFGSEDSQSVQQTRSLTDCWSTIPAVSLKSTETRDDETVSGDLLDDVLDSTFKFSQLQFPTDGPASERSETSEVSFQSASGIVEPSVDEDTMDSSIIEDARIMKFLTTGSVKSSDIDEKLSEAHSHSKNGFNKYEHSKEQRLNLGTKSSGHMPRPHEMLSIYSRGESEPPGAINAKSSPSLNIPIKSAIRKNADARNFESAESTSARPTPSKNVGRSVSFSEKKKEFPWRRTDVLSTPIAVTPAKVETDSPLADSSQKDQNRGGRAEEPTSPEDTEEKYDKNTSRNAKTGSTRNATDDTDKEDADKRNENGQHEKDKNEPKKNASKDLASKQQAAPKRRSSSMDGSGKREKSKQKVDEEPKRSNSDDVNQTSIFSLDNILPFMRLFFTPVMDEVALDMLHVVRGDPGCELCPLRRQEDEAQARVVPRQEGGESGDDDRPRENDEKAKKQQAKEEGDSRQSQNEEQERKADDDRRKSSHKGEEENEEDGKGKRRTSSRKDQEENQEDGKDNRRTSSHKDQEEKEEGDEEKRRQSHNKDHEGKKEVEDGKNNQEDEENKKKHVDETERVEGASEEK